MKQIFTQLRDRLLSLPDEVVAQAVVANGWFTAEEVRRAASGIASEMLSGEIFCASGEQKNVLIVMAGNIPLVGMQDLICVIAAGHRAVVKPSSKDKVLIHWLLEGLTVTFLSDFSGTPDAVIAMGSDDTVRELKAKYEGVPMLLRGNRSSLAVLAGDESVEELAALADDVLSFSGLGCRNVSLVFVPRGYDFLRLQSALKERDGRLNLKYRNNYLQTRAILTMQGVPFLDCGSCLMVENRDFPAAVSRLNYAFYDSVDEVKDWVAEHENEIQCIVPWSVGFGKTQCPALTDYPDGRDTMKFLASI